MTALFRFRFLCLSLALLGGATASKAQLTGTKTVPSTAYPTLKVAIDSLNLHGVGAGGVIINFTASTHETAPVGGYRLGSATLNATTSAANPITINGNGNLITAYTGTSSNADGIFYIMGTDYVTINNLNLTDKSANNTNARRMEWGYALVKLKNTAPYDGCQHVTINGCTITLNGTYTNSIGIRSAHSIAGSASTLSTSGANATSTNSYNRFTGNTISAVTRGISLIGMSSLAYYDKRNEIGGATPASGNSISVGGATTTVYSVYLQYDSVISIRNNRFDIASGQGNGAVYHIMFSSGAGDLTVSGNFFDINRTSTSAHTYVCYNSGSHRDASPGLNARTSHTITDNTITGNNPTATSGYIYGFYFSSAYCKELTISRNKFEHIDWGNATGYLYLFYNYLSQAIDQEIHDNVVYNVHKAGNSGYIYGYYNYSYNQVTGHMSVQNNLFKNVKNDSYIYAFYNYASYTTPPSGYPGARATVKHNVIDSVDMTGTTGTAYLYNYMCYGGFDSTEASYNILRNVWTSLTATNYVYTYIYGYYGQKQYRSVGNRIENVTGNSLYCLNYLGMYASHVDSNVIENITQGINGSTTGYVNSYLGYYNGEGYTCSNNRINNITLNGGYMQTYMGYYGNDANVHHNAITNCNLANNAYMYNYIGYNIGGNSEFHHNRIDSITQGGSANFYPWYAYTNSSGSSSIYNNVISNITTGSTSISLYPYYLLTGGAGAVTNFYNNFLSNVNYPSGYNGINSIGVNLASSGTYNVYHNTIKIDPIAGGTNYGYTGIYYNSGAILDLRNNIINVNVTPAGSGYTTALRRNTGTANTSPANFLGSSNGNIFYAPNVANSWLYGEGTSAASMVNTYNLTNDPTFNTPCGKFKSFLGHNQASFTENNLVAGTLPGTYLPNASIPTYAEKGSVPTASPAVVMDYANTTRPAVADIGALEFTGTPIDNAPPIVSFTPVPVLSYCVTQPTLQVTITDNSGVANTPTTGTTPGTAPRLYFKKTTENNTFGANTSAVNGWKYVEPSSVSGSVYTFVFDYTLLTSTVGAGDEISYFIIAQDNASTPNTGATIAGFPLCPPTVNLGSAHGPLNASPKPHSFKILSTPTFVINSFPGSACVSGSTEMNVMPTPVGATVQWQSATMTGTFSNITGATNVSYTTPVNTTTMRYRAIVSCGTSTLATTVIDTFVIANPAILSVKGDTACGYDSLTLSVTGAPFTTAKWYTSATGGTAFYQGTTYTTPPTLSSVTYYVSANTPNASTEILTCPIAPAPYSYGLISNSGMVLEFKNAATNFYSTTIYPYNATAGSSFDLELLDMSGNPIPASQGGPYVKTIYVSGGNGITPQVEQLNWRNIPAGTYQLLMTNSVLQPYLNFQYIYNTPLPVSTPSGNVTNTWAIYSGNQYNYYWMFFYNNVFGSDCEASGPRTAVRGIINPPPPVTVSSLGSPGICAGTSTTINASSANPSYVYTWTPGPLTGASHTVSPTTKTTYRLISFDPYTGCTDFDTIELFVNPVPAPPTITPTNPTICENSSVVLVGKAPPGKAGIQQVGSGTSTISSMPNPFYGTYTGNRSQYLIRAADMTAAGIKQGLLTSLAFQSSATGYTLNNFEIRLANVSMTAIGSSITCAPGLTLVYTQATLVPPTSGWNTFLFNGSPFTWTGGDLLVDVSNMNCTTCPTTACNNWGSSASVLGSSTSYASAFGVFADNNCGVTACPTTGSYNTAAATTMRPNMRIGYQEPADINWLNVSGLYKNAALTSTVSLTDTNSVVYASPKTTTVYRAVTNAQGCKSLPSLPDTVFVNPAPVVTITPAGPQTICSGMPVTLCVPTGANQTYQWFLNNTAIAGANSNCYVAGGAGNYTVTATNIITGCSATSIPTSLTVNPLPTVTATASGPTTICNGSSVTLTANSPTAVAWQWQESGVNIPGATSSTYAATASGNYSVVVTNSSSCPNTSNVVAITVNTTPSGVTPQGSTSFCSGGSVVLQGPTGAGLSYQWHDGTGPLSGATSSSYTATATGNYYVVVTSASTGCSSTSAPVTVTVGPGPNASISPSGTINGCQGGTVTLSAVSQPGLCYQWNRNGSPITGANSATYAASLNGTYTVTVSLCATPGCSATTATPTTINVNALPTATITPSTVSAFCQGTTATLSANTGAGLTYQWNLGGAPISGATGSTHNAAAGGSYTVTVTSTATGCSNTSAAVPVTVHPLPVINVAPTAPTTFCQGGSVVLPATAGYSSYVWKRNGTTITGATGASYTANQTGIYTVTVSNATTGCSNTSAPMSVQVNALPNVATIPTGNSAVCQGYTTTLTVPSDTAHTYQWYNGTSPIANAVGNTYTTGVAGVYTVRVTNTVTGCAATSQAINLAVNTPPVATASVVGSTTICQDDSVRIDAPVGAGLMYQWKYNGNDIVGAMGASYHAKLGGRYTVAVSNATNCVTLSNSVVITVNPRPAAYITYNTPLQFCEGSAVVLVGNSGQGLSYEWLMDGTPNGNTTDVNIASASGLYSLKVTNSFGCSTGSDALDVVVYPAPVPAISRSRDTLRTAQPYVAYQWFFNNVSIGGATSGEYVFTENGAYKVRVTDANGCEGYSGQYFINNVGIASTPAGSSIRVYPNPTSGVVHIDADVKVKVVLRDVTGKSVLEAEDVKVLDLGDVANGMYLLYISDLDGRLLRAEKVTKTNL